MNIRTLISKNALLSIGGASLIAVSIAIAPALAKPFSQPSPQPSLAKPIMSLPVFTSIESSQPRSVQADRKPGVVRERMVRTNRTAIPRALGATMKLNLFDDATFDVVIDRIEASGTRSVGNAGVTKVDNLFGGTGEVRRTPSTANGTVAIGRVKDMPNSEVVLTQAGDRVSGTVHLPTGEVFEIISKSAKVQVIRQLDTTSFKDHP